MTTTPRQNIPADTKAAHQITLAAIKLLEHPHLLAGGGALLHKITDEESLAQMAALEEAIAALIDCNIKNYLDATINPDMHDAVFSCPDLLLAVESDEGSLLVTRTGSFVRARRVGSGWTLASASTSSRVLAGPITDVENSEVTDAVLALLR